MISDYISIIIPCFNEERRILETLKTLFSFCKSNFEQFEIIVVDDGSTDPTWTIVNSLHDCPFFHVMRNAENKGKGYAVREGMLAARGHYRFFTDADIPYGTEFFLKALKRLRNPKCDMVIGSRDLPESWVQARVRWIRKISSRLFSVIVNIFLHIHIKDSQCGFKGFTAKSAHQIFSHLTIDGFAFDVEIFILAKELGLSIEKLPVTLITNQHSKVRLTSDPFRMIIDILKLSWRQWNSRIFR